MSIHALKTQITELVGRNMGVFINTNQLYQYLSSKSPNDFGRIYNAPCYKVTPTNEHYALDVLCEYRNMVDQLMRLLGGNPDSYQLQYNKITDSYITSSTIKPYNKSEPRPRQSAKDDSPYATTYTSSYCRAPENNESPYATTYTSSYCRVSENEYNYVQRPTQRYIPEPEPIKPQFTIENGCLIFQSSEKTVNLGKIQPPPEIRMSTEFIGSWNDVVNGRCDTKYTVYLLDKDKNNKLTEYHLKIYMDMDAMADYPNIKIHRENADTDVIDFSHYDEYDHKILNCLRGKMY